MSALLDLHLRYDGPIPLAARQAAIAADFETLRSSPRSPVKVRVKSYTPDGIIDRMATVMMAFATGRPCYRADLAQAGFSTKEIDRHGENARALAARRLAEDPHGARPVEIPVTLLLAHIAAMRRGVAA